MRWIKYASWWYVSELGEVHQVSAGCWYWRHDGKSIGPFATEDEAKREAENAGVDSMSEGPWQVGRLHDPQPDDTKYTNVEAATEAAWNLAHSDDVDVFAVWDSRDDVVWIFTGGQQFAPV